MVTTRVAADFSELQRRVFGDIIKRFGRTDITLTTKTYTLNSDKQITAVTETTDTIDGDLQFITYQDKVFLDRGIATIGDGVFYCIYRHTLHEGDRVTVDSVDWELTSMVEAETIDAKRVYQAWITRRRV